MFKLLVSDGDPIGESKAGTDETAFSTAVYQQRQYYCKNNPVGLLRSIVVCNYKNPILMTDMQECCSIGTVGCWSKAIECEVRKDCQEMSIFTTFLDRGFALSFCVLIANETETLLEFHFPSMGTWIKLSPKFRCQT